MKRRREAPVAAPRRPYRATWLAGGQVYRATITGSAYGEGGGTAEGQSRGHGACLVATCLETGRTAEGDTPMECMDELARLGPDTLDVMCAIWANMYRTDGGDVIADAGAMLARSGPGWHASGRLQVPGNAGLYTDEPA